VLEGAASVKLSEKNPGKIAPFGLGEEEEEDKSKPRKLDATEF
jgi:hypothetical protein